MSPGKRFRALLQSHQPLQIVGTPNAISAKLAKKNGFKAIYLSGAGVANGQFALPDLGIINLSDILIDVRRITSACDLPLLVDIDTGGAQPLAIERALGELVDAGAAACHMEDQLFFKRCGHRANKRLCSQSEMFERLQAAVSGRRDSDLYLIARTDARGVEGLDAAITRANAYIAAGADAIFAEALTSLEEFTAFTKAVDAPVLANLTEFGITPLLTLTECKQAQLAMLLYPLTAFRMMNFAIDACYQTLMEEGTQASLVPQMQTREALYSLIGYQHAEKILDDYYQSLEDKKDE